MKPTFFATLVALSVVILAFSVPSHAARRCDDADLRQNSSVAFINPINHGGKLLDRSGELGEPLNVIISGLSHPEVLKKSGLINWARSAGFTTECLGKHKGQPQSANLGDGRGWVDEMGVLRYDYGDEFLGSCLESLLGGNHFRFWQQNSTNAYFLAVSVEDWVLEKHNIVPDGYDLGRDELVGNATGDTEYSGNIYTTDSCYVSGLRQSGTEGINHNIAIDGLVAVLTITGTIQPSHALGPLYPPKFWWWWCCVLHVLVFGAVAI